MRRLKGVNGKRKAAFSYKNPPINRANGEIRALSKTGKTTDNKNGNFSLFPRPGDVFCVRGIGRVTLAEIEATDASLEEEIRGMLITLPNTPADDSPDGDSDEDALELRRVGTPKEFDFKPLEHFELGEKLGLMDSEQAAVLSGARFTLLKGPLARMERALGQLSLDCHRGKAFDDKAEKIMS